MEDQDNFYTLKGYQMSRGSELTSAMEDYLEMIYRILRDNAVARISELSEKLHVTPPSASKMARLLKDAGYVNAAKYGYVTLTESGLETGKYLYRRHHIINRFLCRLNSTPDETEQAEKIEHFLTPETVANLSLLTDFMERSGFDLQK